MNFTGWKWVEAFIPQGTAYPVTLKNIYLAEINETRKDSGTIYIDNLRIMYEPKDKALGLRDETQFIDSMKISSIKNFTEKLSITAEKSELSGSKSGNIIYFDGIVSNGTMSANNTTMWNNIKSFENYKDKVLVLSLNSSLDKINDQREVEVLKAILEKSSKNNQVFVVFKGAEENTVIENNVRYITYDDTFELGITDGGTSYKN
ncbi:hypothetical protein SDC9_185123 [bioreactor metagenome]|uniref:Uncharacterized protein n=1 Tax=bioreactor metagenome TaxID=1076179 RepID=A0A645HQG3_9ZZZZ